MTERDDQRQHIRRDMRRARRALNTTQRRQAAQRLARHLRQQLWFQRARHVGAYLAHGGELDPLPALLGHHDARLYLPVVRVEPELSMQMISWSPGEQLLTNRFGIGEPDPRRHSGRPLWSLDLLLVPLVAFDRHGNRLGMGGGFYDRLLADLGTRPRRPRLVGIAYGFQEVEGLPLAPWDQPLDLIVTD
jgi:5-formyltetrahydrofolate cyclo-ligase